MERVVSSRRLNIGSVILGIGSLSLSGASWAMFSQAPEISSTLGRLVRAGALANLCLALIWSLVAFIPLRQGKKWAFWVYCIPILLYGIPMIYLEGSQVPSEHLVSTLAPQVGGLCVALIGLILVGPVIFCGDSKRL